MALHLRVSLPFQPRWRPAVLAGEKTTTCRTKRHGNAGDEFEVEGVDFRIVTAKQMTLGEACQLNWREEGMASPEEFESTWRANHPTRGWRPEDTVWVHHFERAQDIGALQAAPRTHLDAPPQIAADERRTTLAGKGEAP